MNYFVPNAINVGPFKAVIRFLMFSSNPMKTALYKLAELLLNIQFYLTKTLMCHAVTSQNKQGS